MIGQPVADGRAAGLVDAFGIGAAGHDANCPCMPRLSAERLEESDREWDERHRDRRHECDGRDNDDGECEARVTHGIHHADESPCRSSSRCQVRDALRCGNHARLRGSKVRHFRGWSRDRAALPPVRNRGSAGLRDLAVTLRHRGMSIASAPGSTFPGVGTRPVLTIALISDHAALNREKERYSSVFHYEAPTGQPGFGVGPRRHDGRGDRARRDTLAASCTQTGFIRDGIDLTAAQIGGAVTGDSTRRAATSASTTRTALPTLTSTTRGTSASSSTASTTST